ncbi:hypothetical protein NSA18_11545 [Pasteurella caecimuris]|uniref:hypothetical protein n=1 Tax=Rodentibacter caecimuris TaxID=1796644 RepID=UPI00214F62D9|nr:hypothetical protein [Pasteurella caecimuris]MCR1838513.1 hypothetical protein [Pasteurella caecimuris]MCU0108133.1 hypothetical protein [Pasteurella caecimuris]
MQKKYELLKDDTKEYFGRTLYRIKALISFGTVVAGELGGYIEAEKNLDQSGNAWVYGNARVSGDAQVSSYAAISERKMIFWASNVGSENGTLTVFNAKDGLIVTRGCFTGTVDEFLAKSAKVHDEKTKREYQLLIEVAKSRILGQG